MKGGAFMSLFANILKKMPDFPKKSGIVQFSSVQQWCALTL